MLHYPRLEDNVCSCLNSAGFLRGVRVCHFRACLLDHWCACTVRLFIVLVASHALLEPVHGQVMN